MLGGDNTLGATLKPTLNPHSSENTSTISTGKSPNISQGCLGYIRGTFCNNTDIKSLRKAKDENVKLKKKRELKWKPVNEHHTFLM